MIIQRFRNIKPSYHEIGCLIERMANYALRDPPSCAEIGAIVYNDAVSLFYPDDVHHEVRNVFTDAAEKIWDMYRERRVEEMKTSKENPWRDAKDTADTVDLYFARLVDIMKGAVGAAETAGDARTAALISKLVK